MLPRFPATSCDREASSRIPGVLMDRLDAMSILVAVTEAGSLSAASRQLGTQLATVSRKLSELEAHLKVRLVNRSSRQMTLTEAGRAYVEACRRIIEQVEEAERE